MLSDLQSRGAVLEYAVYCGTMSLWGMKNNELCDPSDPDAKLVVVLSEDRIYDIETDKFINCQHDEEARIAILNRLELANIDMERNADDSSSVNVYVQIRPVYSMEHITINFMLK